jgi:hypothetical protein
MKSSISVDKIVQDFKRTGQYDQIRKKLLEEFSQSPAGKRLYSSLEKIAEVSSAKNQTELVALLTKDPIFKEAERALNGKEFLASKEFKESLRKKLRINYNRLTNTTNEGEGELKDTREDQKEGMVSDETFKKLLEADLGISPAKALPDDSTKATCREEMKLPPGFKSNTFVDIVSEPADDTNDPVETK